MTIDTNCGCSPRDGACTDHSEQARIGPAIAGTVSEADEVRAVVEARNRASRAVWLKYDNAADLRNPCAYVGYNGIACGKPEDYCVHRHNLVDCTVGHEANLGCHPFIAPLPDAEPSVCLCGAPTIGDAPCGGCAV